MPVRAFEPKFMKVGILTAALQELTPRDVRDADPDRAIEDWAAFARELGVDDDSAVGGAPSVGSRRAARSDARPGGEHTRPAAAVRSCARGAGAGRALRRGRRDACRIIGFFDNMLHARSADPREEARVHGARLRRGRPAGRRRGLRLRGPQHVAFARSEPGRLRGALRPTPRRGQVTRPHVPRRAVPDARLDYGRQLLQQHRLHAGHVDRAAPHLREARRRRAVPHSLRSLARHPHGTGHPVGLPVPSRTPATPSSSAGFTSKDRSSTAAASLPGVTAGRRSSAGTPPAILPIA